MQATPVSEEPVNGTGNQLVNLVLTRANSGTFGNVVVTFKVTGGKGADMDKDYRVLHSGSNGLYTTTFANGAEESAIQIEIINDDVPEVKETIGIALLYAEVSDANAAVGAPPLIGDKKASLLCYYTNKLFCIYNQFEQYVGASHR